MENHSGASIVTTLACSGGQNPPPPPASFSEFIFPCRSDNISGSYAAAGEVQHHRTSSDTFLIEQPSWLQELLDEPDCPLYRGHRRSSSDSVAYLDTVDRTFRKEETSRPKNSVTSAEASSGESQENLRNSSIHANNNSFKQQATTWESAASKPVTSFVGSSFTPQELGGMPYKANVSRANQACSSVKNNNSSSASPSVVSGADSKRSKQQFAQRSRLRKLQYIAELESNVQLLQAEGTEVSAALAYLDQQFLILGMENEALKRRLDSLAQEQLVKYLEKEMLEREIERLHLLYHRQQQQQLKHSALHRSKTKSCNWQPSLSNLKKFDPAQAVTEAHF